MMYSIEKGEGFMDIQTLKRNGQIIEVPIDEYLFYQGEAGSMPISY